MASSAAKAGDSDVGAGEALPRSKRLRGKVDADDGQDMKRSRLDAEEGDTKGDVGHDGEKGTERWRVHQMTEDYVEFASNLMLTPVSQLGSYGYDSAKQQYPLGAVSALGYLKSPQRRPMVFEKWSPFEVAVFEASMIQHGKQFHLVQKDVETKTTREVIDFYYMWKKTSHYQKWKKQYSDHSDDESG